jgi:hypothetical protein
MVVVVGATGRASVGVLVAGRHIAIYNVFSIECYVLLAVGVKRKFTNKTVVSSMLEGS